MDQCWAPPPEIFISEMTIQGSVYVQNLMENETIKSDFEFAHIRHTYGTFFEIWAKFPQFWPNFQRFRFSLLRGARAPIYSKWPPTASVFEYIIKIYNGSFLIDIWLQTDIAPDFGPFGRYCTEIAKSSPARGIFGVQKFLRYRRNFWISISGSKFQTWFTFIIFP